VGVFFTASSVSGWYETLNKPVFSPPNWVFGPVWTFLYLLMGISFYLIWKMGWKKKKVRVAVGVFGVQLGLNFFWSPLFFGLRSPELGLVEILFLWVAILVTMSKFYPLSRLSFLLLIPYFLWVSFAAFLNASILVLN
jgi:tryptophan-rich sensory protein